MNNSFKAGWLSGLFDGEGGAYWYDMGKRHHSHRVTVFNTDIGIIETAKKYLTDLGIHYTLRTHKPKGKATYKLGYVIDIQKEEDLKKFSKLIGFRHTVKQQTLKKIVKWVHRPVRLARYVPVAKLKQRYDAGQTYSQIAKAIGFKTGESVRKLLFTNYPGVHISRSYAERYARMPKNQFGQIIKHRA